MTVLPPAAACLSTIITLVYYCTRPCPLGHPLHPAVAPGGVTTQPGAADSAAGLPAALPGSGAHRVFSKGAGECGGRHHDMILLFPRMPHNWFNCQGWRLVHLQLGLS